ncbi:hypothetical protein DFJ73DRAFT_902639, partial [Zopfochytrium polystomum]
YYAQLRFCADHYAPGLDTFGQILACICYVSIAMGVLLVVLQKLLQKTRSRLDDAQSTIPIFSFSQFEWFIILYTVSNIFSGIAMTLASFFDTSSTVFLSLLAIRSFLVYTASLLFVNIVLRSAGVQTPFLKNLRTRFLPSLTIPAAVTLAFTLFQGYYSDYAHFSGDPAAPARYRAVVAVADALYVVCWVSVLVLVLVTRHAFARQLRTLVEAVELRAKSVSPEARRQAAGSRLYRGQGGGGGGGGGGGEPSQADESDRRNARGGGIGGVEGDGGSGGTAALVEAVRAAVVALNWLSAGIAFFLAYAVVFSLTVTLFVGSPLVTVFLTTFVYFGTPYLLSIPLFGFFLYRVIRQLHSLAFRSDRLMDA